MGVQTDLPGVPAAPPTQLPRGRYPATAATIWTVAILVLVIEAVLAFGIPGR